MCVIFSPFERNFCCKASNFRLRRFCPLRKGVGKPCAPTHTAEKSKFFAKIWCANLLSKKVKNAIIYLTNINALQYRRFPCGFPAFCADIGVSTEEFSMNEPLFNIGSFTVEVWHLLVLVLAILIVILIVCAIVSARKPKNGKEKSNDEAKPAANNDEQQPVAKAEPKEEAQPVEQKQSVATATKAEPKTEEKPAPKAQAAKPAEEKKPAQKAAAKPAEDKKPAAAKTAKAEPAEKKATAQKFADKPADAKKSTATAAAAKSADKKSAAKPTEEKKPAAKPAEEKKSSAKAADDKKPAAKASEEKKTAAKTEKAAPKRAPKKEIEVEEVEDDDLADNDEVDVDEVEEKTSTGPKIYHIALRKDNRWQVKLGKGAKALKLFNTQAEAIAFAKEKAKNQDGHIMIHKVDGKIRKQRY